MGDDAQGTSGSTPERAVSSADPLLLNPHELAGWPFDAQGFDPETRRLLLATVEFFESRGKRTLKQHDSERLWYADFLDFVKRERLFATFLTPRALAEGDPDKRWDTARICVLNEILAFYGLAYWYTWQVTILGLGPVWQSDNPAAKARAAALLDGGAVFGFGLSERAHGADIYATDMVLKPTDDGGFRASGSKYYIGNGNVAGMLSVFGRRGDVEGPDGYVFFAVDTQHPSYELVQNVVDSQMFVSEFRLDDYPVAADDVLHTGRAAFDAALNTVNIGKFNLGFASIGICEHALYEALTHAEARVLYGRRVTEFPHVRRMLVDAYARLVAMRLFGDRARDYFRSAAPDDRRYLLFNPLTKMKVTIEGERVVDLLADVIAARGFEKDTYFEMAVRDVRALPKLEGTVHVNMALVLKFMASYFFAPGDLPAVSPRVDASDDEFLFRQGPARGLSAVRFADWRGPYDDWAHLPNVSVLREQAEALRELLMTAPPDETQQQDLDFLLTLGELFTVVVYGQLVLEEATARGLEPDLVGQVFDALVRDFSEYAVQLHGRSSSTAAQQQWALGAVRKPVVDADRFARMVARVRGLANAYEMRP